LAIVILTAIAKLFDKIVKKKIIGGFMALTGWEAGKVGGNLTTKLCTAGETYVDAHPGEGYKPSVAEITALVIETLTELGVEIRD